MAKIEKVAVAKDDVLAAWTILEEITVSLNQIGSAFGIEEGATNGEKLRQGMLEALDAYLTPRVLKALNAARMRLGDYIPDEEAEHLSEHKIPYWNYAGLKELMKRFSGESAKRKRPHTKTKVKSA